jgi:hypothetical protein
MIRALHFTPSATDLSDTARGFLEKRFQQEDYKSYWCDIDSLVDEIFDEYSIFPGIAKFMSKRRRKAALEILPKEWWKMMAFPPKVERAIKKFWKEHPTGKVVWEW